jgi:uncharacterized protein YlxW (UPF0749 family)
MSKLIKIPQYYNKAKSMIWLFPVSLMTMVLGVMLTLSWMTKENRTSRFDMLPAEQRARIATGSLDLTQEHEKLLQEVKMLREENTKFQNSVARKTGQSRLLNESLQKTKMFAGLTSLEGPGIVVTLQDYRDPKQSVHPTENNIIHDGDVLRVVNELWNAGAEGVSVNELRVVIGTHFRCVGSVILVKNVKVSNPIVVKAIGDSKTLIGAMKLPGGVLDEIRTYGHPNMVKMTEVPKMKLSAYSGATNHTFGDLPEEKQ